MADESKRDEELVERINALRSEIDLVVAAGKPPAGFAAVKQDFEKIHNEEKFKPDVMATLRRLEAEMCLYKPKELLYPTAVRLRDRMYRLSEVMRAAWTKDLDRLFPDETKIVEEPVARTRLRQLSYEVARAAESYSRLAAKKAKWYRDLIFASIATIAAALSALVYVEGKVTLGESFENTVLYMAIGGVSGAAASVASTQLKEKAREELFWTQVLQMGLRCGLGALYAIVVFSAIWGAVIPVSAPEDETRRPAFFFVVAFAAGYTDRLLHESLSRILPSSGGSKKKK